MEKSLEQLKQEYEKTTVLLEREKRKMQRLKNRQAYLESGSRKQRTHRLITRGAAIESIAPPVSYTHLDVYKRQVQSSGKLL